MLSERMHAILERKSSIDCENEAWKAGMHDLLSDFEINFILRIMGDKLKDVNKVDYTSE